MEASIFTHRFIGRFIVEAQTPLYVGSGLGSLIKDALVQKDVNGYPMIPGSSIAGVLRHLYQSKHKDQNKTDKIFGSSKDADNANGSLLKISAAHMILNGGFVSEGLRDVKQHETDIRFQELPIRQHVRINDKGAAEENGLFDNEIVYKGARYMFEIELKGTEEYMTYWDEIFAILSGEQLRVGSGSRNGYGKLQLVEHYIKKFDLRQANDFNAYLNYDPSFNSKLPFESSSSNTERSQTSQLHYKLELIPDSFFIFGEGSGDNDVDNKPLEEEVIIYQDAEMKFETQTVIPATSIKGAIAHRVAFHYNKNKELFADKENSPCLSINPAVIALFGTAGPQASEAQAGHVYINDCYLAEDEISNTTIFNHVAIDRFTGGALEGALFNEKVSFLLKDNMILSIIVDQHPDVNEVVLEALEESLKDITKGLLPLGGMTTKGHGMFTGKLYKNHELIFDYNSQN